MMIRWFEWQKRRLAKWGFKRQSSVRHVLALPYDDISGNLDEYFGSHCVKTGERVCFTDAYVGNDHMCRPFWSTCDAGR